MRTFYFFLILLLCTPIQTFADIIMPKIFADGMVLQRDIPVPIWGQAEAGEKVTVTFLGKRYVAKADNTGRWQVKLAEMKAGGAFEMTIQGKGKNIITIKNIMVGEVWICSGQSNMEWKIDWLPYKNTEPALANFPQIRMFTVPKDLSALPKKDITGGSWKEAVGDNVRDFSAVAYFFGKELYNQYKIPIGLINTSWGGTIAETWMSAGAAKQIPEFKERVERLEKSPDLLENAKKQAEELKKRILGTSDTKETGIMGKWWKENTDLSAWKEMKIPTLWEEEGLSGLDGVVWFRKEFELSESQIKKDIYLHLGMIDDNEETYLNGELVGQTKGYNQARIYKIPAEKLKIGKNVIVVRVTDTGGGGGIYGKADDLFVRAGEEKIASLAGSWKYKIDAAEQVSISLNQDPNSNPTLLFNAMIAPLVPYAIKGAIWYQGESNAGRAYQYRTVFPSMIQDWRNQWAQPQKDFPFLFVQLANFMKFEDTPKESDWAELREAQTMTLALPNTGMAVIIDIGEGADIHPKNKYDVGQRLALAARKIAYQEDIHYASPMYQSMQVQDNKAIITFKHLGNGLIAKDRYGYVKGFTIAGEDKKFYWAKAYLEGNQVVVYSEYVTKPVAVRYAWANNPEDLNLFSKDGLPVCPFRTDDWQGITFGKK